MTAYAIMSLNNETRRVIDASDEYLALCDAGWNIDDIIGESEADEERRLAEEAHHAAIAEIRAIADRLGALAETFGWSAGVQWSSGSSAYVTAGPYKIRVSDHQALYACDISVSPDEMSEAEATQWLRTKADEEAE